MDQPSNLFRGAARLAALAGVAALKASGPAEEITGAIFDSPPPARAVSASPSDPQFDMYTQGEKMAQAGDALIMEGRDLIAEGEARIAQGERMTAQGKRIQEEARAGHVDREGQRQVQR
jgi:hypothetical protein